MPSSNNVMRTPRASKVETEGDVYVLQRILQGGHSPFTRETTAHLFHYLRQRHRSLSLKYILNNKVDTKGCDPVRTYRTFIITQYKLLNTDIDKEEFSLNKMEEFIKEALLVGDDPIRDDSEEDYDKIEERPPTPMHDPRIRVDMSLKEAPSMQSINIGRPQSHPTGLAKYNPMKYIRRFIYRHRK